MGCAGAMSVVPKAGAADTFATGGSTTTFDVLVGEGMVLDGDGVAVVEGDVGVPLDDVIAGTGTAVEEAAVVPTAGEDAGGVTAAVTWLDTVTVPVEVDPEVQAEVRTTRPTAADTHADRRTA